MNVKLTILKEWYHRMKWYQLILELPQMLVGIIHILFNKVEPSDHFIRKELLVLYTPRNVRGVPLVYGNLVLINDLSNLRYSSDYMGFYYASKLTGWFYLFKYLIPSRLIVRDEYNSNPITYYRFYKSHTLWK